MSQPSTTAVLSLFARTAVRRFLNRSSIFKRLFQRKPAPGEPERTGTLSRTNQSTLGARLLTVFLVGSTLLGTIMLVVMSTEALIEAVGLDELRSAKTMVVSQSEYDELKEALAQPAGERDAKVKEVTDAIGSDYLVEWVKKGHQQEAEKRMKAAGLAGFRPVEPSSTWGGELAYLSPAGRLRALRSVGLYLLVLNVAMTGLGLALMSKSLTSPDPSLTWLFQFPVSRWVLFLSQMVEYTFDNGAILVTACVSGMVLGMSGAGFLSGLGMALTFGLSAAVACAALRVLFEVLLVQFCSRKARGLAVALASNVGGLALLFAMLFNGSEVTVRMAVAAADLFPNFLFWNPFSLGYGTPLSATVFNHWLWAIPPVTSAAMAAFAVWAAARMTAGGLAPQLDAVRGTTAARAHAEAGESRFSGLVRKELLQLRRQPEFLGQVLLSPILILGLLWLRNPEVSLTGTMSHPGLLSMAVFASGAYLLLIAATGILRTELKTLWFLQCQPRSLADCLQTKARIWAVVAMIPILLLVSVSFALHAGHRLELLMRLPCLLVGTWLFAEACFAVFSLGACVSNEQTVKYRSTTYVLPALLSSEMATALYVGHLWSMLAALTVLAVIVAALRQRQQSELGWISEPVETPPLRIEATNALYALYGFLFVRDVLAAVMAGAEVEVPLRMSVSYCVAAVVVALLVLYWQWRSKLWLPAMPRQATLLPVLQGLAVTWLVGLLWVALLRQSPEIVASAQAYLKLPTTLAGFDENAVLRILTVVIAAPIFEEWLFRGLLYRTLRRSWSVGVSVALSTLLFTVIHPASSSAAVATLGLVTALTFERTGRLWPGMLIHFGYNLFIMALWTCLV